MPRHGCASCSDKAAFVRTNVSPPRSCRFFIAPFSHDLDSSPQSGRATRPLFLIPAFEASALLPLLSSTLIFSCRPFCRRAIFPAALSGRDDAKVNPLPGIILLPARPAHAAFFPWFLMPPHPRKEQAPKYSARRRRAPAGFVRLPAFALRPHSASAFRLHPFPFAPGHSFRLQPTCFRPAASPYAKGPPADADGPLHCNKTPIRIQACIPG